MRNTSKATSAQKFVISRGVAKPSRSRAVRQAQSTVAALLGLALQDLALGLLGTMLPAWPAAGAGLLAAVPANAVLSRLIGAVWPHDETTAVEIALLVGRRGRIAVGTAAQGNPARAVVHDRHGQMHNVMVEPHEPGQVLPEGTEVLLVRLDRDIFYAVEPQGTPWLADRP